MVSTGGETETNISIDVEVELKCTRSSIRIVNTMSQPCTCQVFMSGFPTWTSSNVCTLTHNQNCYYKKKKEYIITKLHASDRRKHIMINKHLLYFKNSLMEGSTNLMIITCAIWISFKFIPLFTWDD